MLDQADEQANLQEFAFGTQASYTEVLYEDREDLAVAYQKGLCDAVSAPASWLNAIRRSLADGGSQAHPARRTHFQQIGVLRPGGARRATPW